MTPGEQAPSPAPAQPAARVPRSSAVRGRRLLLAAGVLLTAAVLAAGAAAWYICRRETPPPPPEVKEDAREPAVGATLRKARERVLKDPHSARAWGDLGEAFIGNDREEESFPCFARAEKLDPVNPRWPYLQAGTLINRGDRDGALPYLERAADRCDAAEENNPVPRLFLAETLLTLGRGVLAEAHLRHVLEHYPDEVRVHFDLGLLASSRQNWQAARDHFLRCLNSPQARQKASAQLAAVCSRLGDAAEADRFRELAERAPRDLDWTDPFVIEYLRWAVKKKSRYRLVENLEAAGRLAEAVEMVQPMLEEYPDDYLPRVTLAKLLGPLGDYARAERAMREARRLAPDKVQVHYYLSLVLLMEGQARLRAEDRAGAENQFRESADLARQSLAQKPDYGFAHMTLGLSLKFLGRRAEALASLRRAVLCNPEVGELHFHVGEMLADDGQAAEARRQLEQAVQLGPPEAAWRRTALDRLAALKADPAPKKDAPGRNP